MAGQPEASDFGGLAEIGERRGGTPKKAAARDMPVHAAATRRRLHSPLNGDPRRPTRAEVRLRESPPKFFQV